MWPCKSKDLDNADYYLSNQLWHIAFDGDKVMFLSALDWNMVLDSHLQGTPTTLVLWTNKGFEDKKHNQWFQLQQ